MRTSLLCCFLISATSPLTSAQILSLSVALSVSASTTRLPLPSVTAVPSTSISLAASLTVSVTLSISVPPIPSIIPTILPCSSLLVSNCSNFTSATVPPGLDSASTLLAHSASPLSLTGALGVGLAVVAGLFLFCSLLVIISELFVSRRRKMYTLTGSTRTTILGTDAMAAAGGASVAATAPPLNQEQSGDNASDAAGPPSVHAGLNAAFDAASMAAVSSVPMGVRAISWRSPVRGFGGGKR